MSVAVQRLLFEAYRRNRRADDTENRKPLEQRWLGLGSKSAYRPVLEAGLMRFHDGKNPPPRCMGWLVLTPKGVTAMKALEAEFAEVMDRLEANPEYQRSIRANYMMAGGVLS